MQRAKRPVSTTCIHCLRQFLVMLTLAVATACDTPKARVGLDGGLTVLRPDAGMSVHDLSDDWIVMGTLPPIPVVTETTRDGAYLRLTTGNEAYAVLRRTDAQLLATPYLSWQWAMRGEMNDTHGVRLTVGLTDGPAQRSYLSALNPFSSGLPKFSRTVTLLWSRSALSRGSVTSPPPADDVRPVARYTVRGGRENLGRWWSETIDLSAIHAKAWPELDMATTRVAFVGVSAVAGSRRGEAGIRNLRLSR